MFKGLRNHLELKFMKLMIINFLFMNLEEVH